MGLGKTKLPGKPCVVDGTFRRCPGAAVITGDQDHLGPGLCHAGSHRAHSCLGDQLYGNTGVFIRIFQVIDQLGQILDGVDIVVRRRGDQADSGRGVPGLRDPGVDLPGRKVAALAGLCPLRHLDLDLFGADQIPAGDPEPCACHLLDGRAPVVLGPGGIQTLLAFSSFSGVGFPVEQIHGDSQGLMGFLGNGPVGHGAGLKPLYDLFHAFYFFQGNPFLREPEVHQGAQIAASLLIHHPGVFLEKTVVSHAGGFLQHMDGGRIVPVFLAAASHLVFSQAVQGQIHRPSQGIKGLGVKGFYIFRKIIQGDPAYPAHCAGKIPVDHFF